jgi:hypothetical protein
MEGPILTSASSMIARRLEIIEKAGENSKWFIQ